ncbi:MAG: glycine zipper family protein, partial [Thiogranum sp.]|nr:glycine zipper family protein [Thiogranum sp.]
GAAIGAIAGDTGKGAAIGAATGGLFGGMRQREANAQQQQQTQQQSAAAAGKADTYNRAYAACLEGRGYTVR